MTPGLIAGIVLFVLLIIAFIYILRSNPNTPRRRKRTIEDDS